MVRMLRAATKPWAGSSTGSLATMFSKIQRWDAARVLEIRTVFTLTYVAEFFEKCGYHRVDKAELPHKIWNECVRCPLFPNCTEIALIRTASTTTAPANGILAAAGA